VVQAVFFQQQTSAGSESLISQSKIDPDPVSKVH